MENNKTISPGGFSIRNLKIFSLAKLFECIFCNYRISYATEKDRKFFFQN